MPAAKGGNGDFVVRLEGLPLTDEVRSRIAGEIQSLVMREIARIDTRGDLNARIPYREWWGLWLRKDLFKGIESLQVNIRG